jgi:hypothetical protein
MIEVNAGIFPLQSSHVWVLSMKPANILNLKGHKGAISFPWQVQDNGDRDWAKATPRALHPDTLTLFTCRQKFDASLAEGLFNGVYRAHA